MDNLEEFVRRLSQQTAARASDEDDPIIDAELVDDSEPIRRLEDTSGEARGGRDRTAAFEVAKLAQAVEMADERMDSRLDSVFEHQLGRLGTMTSPVAPSVHEHQGPAVSVPAAGVNIASMLRSPQNLRTVVVLSEILRRPEDCW